MIYHQLARKVWWYQTPKIISHFGYYIFEPIILFIYSTLAKIANSKIITISESSKKDLIKFGFKREDINIFSLGIKMPEIKKEEIRNKLNSDIFKVLFHSSLRSMKRPEEAVESFCLFLNSLSKEDRFFVRMDISGGGEMFDKCKSLVEGYGHGAYFVFHGRTTDDKKNKLMKDANLLLCTSVKEGWGLIVTEANSQGTPALVYDVDGLRDSSREKCNVVCKENIESMSRGINDIFLEWKNEKNKTLLRYESCVESSQGNTFKNSYLDFKNIMNLK